MASDDAGDIVRFRNVTKTFRREKRRGFFLRAPLSRVARATAVSPDVVALSNVSFTIKAGECVGILGPNGAGKSTLLRLIAGTCFPKTGEVSVRGRVAPLLALGVGFNPDMTGTECVWLGGRLLGLAREEVRSKVAAIVEFAGAAAIMEEPLRHASSGMQARLAFSIAVHSAPDLLLVDEALAVGDLRFQEKCFATFESMRARGATIVLVSHSPDALRRACTRALWLRDGALHQEGPADRVVDAYVAESATR